MTDLTAAVDAAARAWFDHQQAGRKDDGRLRPDGQPWSFDDLPALDQHAARSFVLPLVTAAAVPLEATVRAMVAADLLAHPAEEWALAGQHAGEDAARIVRGEPSPVTIHRAPFTAHGEEMPS